MNLEVHRDKEFDSYRENTIADKFSNTVRNFVLRNFLKRNYSQKFIFNRFVFYLRTCSK